MSRAETWVIIGAGASGSAFAAASARDTRRRILVLEAGPVPPTDTDTPVDVTDARFLRAAVPGHPMTASHRVMLTPDHPYDIVRGATLGGSTAINGTYCVRPPDSDLVRWQGVMGIRSWGPSEFGRAFREIENDRDYGHFPDHGSTGPLPITREAPTKSDLAIRDAFGGVGLPAVADLATHTGPGVGMLPKNVLGTRRQDAGSVFLRPLMEQGRVEVLGDTRATKIVVERGVAVGVEVKTSDGSLEVISADRVVMCAGAVSSATLLMRSGIGPREVLEASGVSCTVDSPAIGQRFCDHPNVALTWDPTAPYLEAVKDAPPFSVIATLTHGDNTLEVLPVQRPLGHVLDTRPTDHQITWLVSLLTPRSRGELRLDPENPLGDPLIDYHYFTDSSDLDSLAWAVGTASEVLAHQSMEGFVSGRPVFADEDAKRSWVMSHLGTSYHTTSTVPAGQPGQGAVDGRGSVYGVENLQVADVSILPDGPTRGPSFLAMALGWKLGSAPLD